MRRDGDVAVSLHPDAFPTVTGRFPNSVIPAISPAAGCTSAELLGADDGQLRLGEKWQMTLSRDPFGRDGELLS